METALDIISEISKGKYDNYLKYRKETVCRFKSYLSNNVWNNKYRNVFQTILDLEEKEIIENKKYILDLCVMYNLSSYYEYFNKELKFKFIKLIIYCINKANGSDNFYYVNKVFKVLSKNQPLLNRLVEIIFSYEKIKKVLFYQYVSENFKTLNDAGELIQEVGFWDKNFSKVLSDKYYIENAANKSKSIIKDKKNDIECIKQIRESFDKMFSSDTFRNNMMKIYVSSEEELLNNINMEEITLSEIKNIAETIKYAENSKIKIIKYVNYALNVFKGKKLEKIFEEFYTLDKSNLYFVKKILKRILADSISEETYSLIVFAHTDFNELCIYDKLFEYINSNNIEELFAFIKWSFDKGVFKNKRSRKTDKYYIEALRKYLSEQDQKIFKSRKILKQYFTHEESRKIIEEIKYENSNAITKLLYKQS